jgi:hypothetical protein
VVGDLIGTGAAQERGVVGETLNLAARLQGLAAPLRKRFRWGGELRVIETGACQKVVSLTGYRRFESISLQERVHCELDRRRRDRLWLIELDRRLGERSPGRASSYLSVREAP